MPVMPYETLLAAGGAAKFLANQGLVFFITAPALRVF